MNQEQVMGLIRQLLPLLAGIATTLGWLHEDQAADLSGKLLTAAGALIAFGSAAWSLASKTDTAILNQAIALPAVQSIHTKRTPEGEKLAGSVPNQNVVLAMSKSMVEAGNVLGEMRAAFPPTKPVRFLEDEPELKEPVKVNRPWPFNS